MNYSYVMGIGVSINELKEKGFVIENDGDNFMVSFSKEKCECKFKSIIKDMLLGNHFYKDKIGITEG